MSAAVLSTGVPARRSARALPAKRHICFVAPYAWPVLSRDASLRIIGGAEVQQCILMRLLARQGWRVSLISLDFGQPDGAEVDGIKVFKTFKPDEGLPVLRFLHPRLTRMWQALTEVDADVYYLRSASMLAGVIDEFCRRTGRRSIYAAASNDDFEPVMRQIRYARDRWLYRRGLARVDRVVVQNEFQKNLFERQYKRAAVLIPSCYELPQDAEPGRGNCVLWVGRMDVGKRPGLAVEVARRLPHRRFVIVGGEAHGAAKSDALERAKAAAAGLANVQFTGFQPLAEVEHRFDEARVLLNTSEYEGMPNTFLQAWARGVPTVATVDVGPQIYPIRGDADGLADEVEKLFENEAWESASRACREHFEATHSSAAVMARYVGLLEELVQ
jgi:glycosyltransferase involved in cell wall biosynthesis